MKKVITFSLWGNNPKYNIRISELLLYIQIQSNDNEMRKT
jgi:hypothetical protein